MPTRFRPVIPLQLSADLGEWLHNFELALPYMRPKDLLVKDAERLESLAGEIRRKLDLEERTRKGRELSHQKASS